MREDATKAISDMLDDNAGSLGAAALRYHGTKDRCAKMVRAAAEMKTQLEAAEAQVAKMKDRLRRYGGWIDNQIDCTCRETHGECPRCTGALICIEACDLGDPKTCPRCGHEDHLSAHPDCPGVNRAVASGDLVPRSDSKVEAEAAWLRSDRNGLLFRLRGVYLSIGNDAEAAEIGARLDAAMAGDVKP